MHILTINERACAGSDCTAHICESNFEGLQEFIRERGKLVMSQSVYEAQKDKIDALIRSCPNGAVSVSKPA